MSDRIQRLLPVIDGALFAVSAAISLLAAALLSPFVSLETIPWGACAAAIPAVILLKLVMYRIAGVYRVYWPCAGFRDAVKICAGAGASSAALLAVLLAGQLAAVVPPAAVVIDLVFTLALTGGLRFAERAFREFWPGLRTGKRAIIVGAGAAGQLVGRELRQRPESGVIPVCYVDDDPGKTGQRIHDIPVGGRLEDLPGLIRRYRASEVIVAIASAPRQVIAGIIENARAAGADFKIVPRLSDIVAGAVEVSDVEDIRVQDLLGRDPEAPRPEALREYYAGRTVMVTGAGGSIGSELCRQLAFLGPRKLVLFEFNEGNLYHLTQELAGLGAPAPLVPVLGDIRDQACLGRVFDRHRPEIVLHAAAYKHVPLLEENVAAAVTNNVLGTKALVEAAVEARVERFVLVSTDKAVRPSSIMGCTKRVAEFICRHAAQESSTEFVTVRFGNVLDSDGSVVPLFRRQIDAGGPVTVTHREVTRYFMSIPEAAGLVLMVGRIGQPSEVYVLEMGKPVRIDDLARQMIQLAGYVPERDIEITYTGLRPGEKLHEQLWYAHEELVGTEHPGIMAASSENGLPADLDASIERLAYISTNGATGADLGQVLAGIVPEFKSQKHPRPVKRGVDSTHPPRKPRRPSEILRQRSAAR